MSKMLVLDTQSWVWFLEGNARLSASARQGIGDPNVRLAVPAIALVEACWMSRKGRTSLTTAELQTAVTLDQRLVVEPLHEEIIFIAADISALPDIHDCLIVATALYLCSAGVTVGLVTADQAIQNFVGASGGGTVRIIW